MGIEDMCAMGIVFLVWVFLMAYMIEIKNIMKDK